MLGSMFVPIMNDDEPIITIMNTIGAHYFEEDALACCVDGDWVVELQVVKISKAKSSFILEVVEDGEHPLTDHDRAYMTKE